ncbi:MAG: hypothetical protein RMY28_012340 [Nostoc sp. ChiSLP01]|nr:hypothetical protein [Nostoc sp. CmiSLP01]MDZ8289181.1 hypothetical protein [Nostoc sp. ChiSLP01]
MSTTDVAAASMMMECKRAIVRELEVFSYSKLDLIGGWVKRSETNICDG